MNQLLNAIQKSLVSLLIPQVWMRFLFPLVIVAFLFVTFSFLFWSSLHSMVFAWWDGSWGIHILAWPFQFFFNQAQDFVTELFTVITALVLLFSSFYVITVFLISVVLLPMLLPFIVEVNYPELKAHNQGSFWAGVWNGLKSFMKFLLGFVMTLPLWLIPGAPFLLTLMWQGYLSAQVFPYDVLQDWATAEEIQFIRYKQYWMHFLLGTATAALFLIPVVNFVAPCLMALLFIHYDLEVLCTLRSSRSLKKI